jgi:hypothetical protein
MDRVPFSALPSLAVTDVADRAGCDPEAGGNVPMALNPEQRADLGYLLGGELGHAVPFALGEVAEPSPQGMLPVLAGRDPFKVAQVVVRLVPILVIALMPGGRRTNKRSQD